MFNFSFTKKYFNIHRRKMRPSYSSQLSVLCLMFLFEIADCQSLFYITYSKDPEPIPTSHEMALTLKPNHEFSNQKELDRVADQLGDLFAGRQEFPWVVDVRGEDLDQEFWAIGNIVSFRHVLTTCRFILFHTRHVATREWAETHLNPALNLSEVPIFDNNKKVLRPVGVSTQIEVFFATTYVWDFFRPKAIVEDGRINRLFARDYFESNSRLAAELIMHPECSFRPTYKKDVGIIELMNSIKPTGVTRAYMPVYIVDDQGNKEIIYDDLANHVRDNIVCYVASFGRNYVNIKNHDTIDFKVKYRVYKEPLSKCVTDFFPKYKCGMTNGLCSLTNESVPNDYLMCFNSRAKVGAVCDHDNGAPLVCDGSVYGIVVLGASGIYCNNLFPIPFLVLNVYSFPDYFMAYSESLSTFRRVASEFYYGDRTRFTQRSEAALTKAVFIFNALSLIIIRISF